MTFNAPEFVAGPPAAPAPLKKKPFYKKLWFWIVVAAVLVAGALTGTAGSGSDGTTAAGGSAVVTDEAVASVGTPVRDGDFEFTVTDVTAGKTEIGSEYLTTTAQGEFVLIELTVKNIGDEPGTFFDQNAKLFDGQGREFHADSSAAIYLEDNAQVFIADINPGNQVSGTLVFDVPAGTDVVTLQLHDSAFSGGVQVSLE